MDKQCEDSTGVFYLVQIFDNLCKTSENRDRRSTKPTRRRTKVREGIDIDTIVTFALLGFEWNRSDACVDLSSRRSLSLASTKLPHSKPYLGFSGCDMYDLLQQRSRDVPWRESHRNVETWYVARILAAHAARRMYSSLMPIATRTISPTVRI